MVADTPVANDLLNHRAERIVAGDAQIEGAGRIGEGRGRPLHEGREFVEVIGLHRIFEHRVGGARRRHRPGAERQAGGQTRHACRATPAYA
jgi:hypothetical protein